MNNRIFEGEKAEFGRKNQNGTDKNSIKLLQYKKNIVTK